MSLAPITHNGETINAEFAPSLNRAFTELHRRTGIWAVVRSPNGGGRTKAQCIALGLPWWVSDHYEGHPDRAAADIWNHPSFPRAVLVEVMKAEGWENVTVDGRDFPAEPWHFAKNPHTSPAAAGGFTILSRKREPEMQFVQIKDAKGKPLYTFDGYAFVGVPAGQGGMFTALLGKPTRISQATFNAAQAQGARHLEAIK